MKKLNLRTQHKQYTLQNNNIIFPSIQDIDFLK